MLAICVLLPPATASCKYYWLYGGDIPKPKLQCCLELVKQFLVVVVVLVLNICLDQAEQCLEDVSGLEGRQHFLKHFLIKVLAIQAILSTFCLKKLNLRTEQKSLYHCIIQWACVKICQAEQQCILCP